MWSPDAYLRYSDERSRPFLDLIGRIDDTTVREIVDVGCGPGTLTPELIRRWPEARVRGLDSSPEMIAAARQHSAGSGLRVSYALADARDFHPDATVDAVITNATLQWIPEQEHLVARWARALRPGAWLALQVPGNQDAPAHVLLRELCRSPRWRDELGTVAGQVRAVPDPQDYARLLRDAGCSVDAWETTYLHQLPVEDDEPTGIAGPVGGGEHPVLSWLTGTALRPVRSGLPDAGWEAFRAELQPRLAAAYPATGAVVDFPFRRVFAVASRR